MRVKHKKWAEPLIEAHPEKITTDPAQFKGKWQSRFAKEQPIWLEVGMGKGQFAIGMAKAHPEVNFIGLDVVSTVAGIALKSRWKMKNCQTCSLSVPMERVWMSFLRTVRSIGCF